MLVETAFHRSDVYKQAVAKAEESTELREFLGAPLVAGRVATGSIHLKDSEGYADLSIPVSGLKGKGLIHLIAVKSGGPWQFRTLQVSVGARADVIDLLSLQPPTGREF